MPEFYLDVWPVNYERIFVTGRVPGVEDFSVELTKEQRRMYEAFMDVQRNQEQDFLLGLVS